MVKTIVHKLNPLNNEKDMSKMMFIIKKTLAFLMIYFLAAIIGEVVVICVLSAQGYDLLHGVMPGGDFAILIQYYAFAIFAILTILYCKVIEKRSLKSMGITKEIGKYLIGVVIACLMLIGICVISCLTKSMRYDGYSSNAICFNMVLWLVAFMIQGATEEIMCRGFLLQSLNEKVSLPIAIVVSSIAFTAPHIPTLFMFKKTYAVIGIFNLFLVSIVFSLLLNIYSNIWLICGLHSIWNFILYNVLGLHLSGSEELMQGIFNLRIDKASILNGGSYGIEAGVVTAFVLGATCIIILIIRKVKNSGV